MIEISLGIIICLVLVLPVTVHYVERNLEIFLLILGILAVSFSHWWGNEPIWSVHFVKEMFTEPLPITAAVVIAGGALHFFRNRITRSIILAERSLGSRLFIFSVIAFLGIISSLITAIIAALLLVEVISILKYHRNTECKIVIIGCFSIGLGAALTPIGEPLATIAIAKLRGDPFNAGFLFLFKNLGLYVIPGILLMSVLGSFIVPVSKNRRLTDDSLESAANKISDVFIRAGKVYIFIVALVLLGTGFKPVVDQYVVALPGALLYWINMLSAVMDNATLAAAEISPRMTSAQIQYILMGLLISGGMLIPGNIPNIIAAGKLNIRSKEWAKFGVPLGLALMMVYSIVFELIRRMR